MPALQSLLALHFCPKIRAVTAADIHKLSRTYTHFSTFPPTDPLPSNLPRWLPRPSIRPLRSTLQGVWNGFIVVTSWGHRGFYVNSSYLPYCWYHQQHNHLLHYNKTRRNKNYNSPIERHRRRTASAARRFFNYAFFTGHNPFASIVEFSRFMFNKCKLYK